MARTSAPRWAARGSYYAPGGRGLACGGGPGPAGVEVYATPTAHSTCLRLEYPTANLDERVIYVTSTAGTFAPADVIGVQARAFVIGPTLRGEVEPELLAALSGKGAQVAVDVQGFVRVLRDGRLAYEDWPEKETVLPYIDIFKTDAVEAEMLTGQSDIHAAARMLAGWGQTRLS